jgi:dephospho-CoA kinase
MIVLGLTGSLAMGKSTAARMLRRMGLPLHDADAEVHRLLGPKGAAVAEVEAAFPGVVAGDAVDRRALGRIVFQDPDALRRLEAILHPKVRAAALAFIKRQRRARQGIVVLDIPLLFETGADRLCDAVIVVSAPAFLQRARALSRPGMTLRQVAAIRARQMPEQEKRRRADFIVQTGRAKGYTYRALRRIVRELKRRTADEQRREDLDFA